jgi:hypothetical protein
VKEAMNAGNDLKLTVARYESLLKAAKVTDLVYMCVSYTCSDRENQFCFYLGLGIIRTRPTTVRSVDSTAQDG